MKSIPKIIFYCLCIGILTDAFKTYNLQKNLEFILSEEVYGQNAKLIFYGYLLISIAAILSFLLYRKYFPNYVTFCYLGLIALVFIASFNDMGKILKTPSFLYSVKGIGTFVNIGILFFAANTYYFPKVLKLFYYICFAFIIAGIINLGKVGFGADRQQFLYAIREFSIYLIWVFPFFLLQNEEDKKKNILNLGVYFVVFIFILAGGSRTYMIIYLLYFIVKFKNFITGKNAFLAIIGTAILFAAAFFILSNSSLNKTMEGAFNNLSERTSEDSRSGQIVEFLNEYDVNYLMQGVGPFKTWYWSIVGQYAFLDNQFLLLGWWAGLPTVLVYIFFLIKSFFLKSEVLFYQNIKGIKLIIGLWFLACLGFAVFVTISSDLYYYFLTLLMGLHTCKFSKIYTPDIEEA